MSTLLAILNAPQDQSQEQEESHLLCLNNINNNNNNNIDFLDGKRSFIILHGSDGFHTPSPLSSPENQDDHKPIVLPVFQQQSYYSSYEEEQEENIMVHLVE